MLTSGRVKPIGRNIEYKPVTGPEGHLLIAYPPVSPDLSSVRINTDNVCVPVTPGCSETTDMCYGKWSHSIPNLLY